MQIDASRLVRSARARLGGDQLGVDRAPHQPVSTGDNDRVDIADRIGILGDTTVAAAMLDWLLHRSVVLNLDGGLLPPS